MEYFVEPGDCISSIAFEHGFFWQTLWNLSDNADLKNQRKNPNVLLTGDQVIIPDKTIKQVSCATDGKYKFVRKGVPEKLHIKLVDYDHQPRPYLNYTIVIDGRSGKGRTDATGVVHENIPPNAQSGKLTFAAPQRTDSTGKKIPPNPPLQTMLLQLGMLNPISETSGVKARLANLGFYKGPMDENLDARTKAAISAFQSKQGLPVTGDLDDATRQKLLSLHGH